MNKSTSQQYNPYEKALLTMNISLPIVEVTGNREHMKEIFEQKVAECNEGECIVEGFVKPNTITVLNYSAGKIAAEKVAFNVTYECMICNPVEGLIMNGVVKTITKAGIHAEVIDENNNIPIVIFLSREHNAVEQFSQIKENDIIKAVSIGIRFELTDPSVTVIALLVNE